MTLSRTFSNAKKTLYNIDTDSQNFHLPYDQWPSTSFEQCRLLGISVEGLQFIHIAGTKGKGSTCAFIEKLLRDQGLTTALFTSPHLVSPCERIRINGEPISEDEFTETFWSCYDILTAQKTWLPHYFRMTFFMFLKIARKRNIDVAIVEVGIGGRYDSTNFIVPQVCGITLVDFDHQNLLGNNLQAIAWHKAGIMKEKVPVVIQRTQPEEVFSVFRATAQQNKSKMYIALPLDMYEQNRRLQICGQYQRDNAALAIGIVQVFLQKRAMGASWTPAESLRPFPLSEMMRTSLETTWNAGRSHILSWPITEDRSITVYLDGAHTSSTVASCSNWYADTVFHGPNALKVQEAHCVLLFTVTNLKDPFLILQSITATKPNGELLFDDCIFSTSNKRDAPLTERQELELDSMRTSWQTLHSYPVPRVASSVPKALAELETIAYCNPFKQVVVLVCGSFYLVGSTLALLAARGVDVKVFSVSHVS